MADAPGQTLEMRAGVATREPRTALSGGRAVEEEGGGGSFRGEGDSGESCLLISQSITVYQRISD
jgi:hypothetical protein